ERPDHAGQAAVDSSSSPARMGSSPDRDGEAFETAVEDVVRRRERQPRPAPPRRTEPLSGRDDEPMLVEQELGRQTVGQADPHVERSLARCRELAGDGEYTAASLFVQ